MKNRGNEKQEEMKNEKVFAIYYSNLEHRTPASVRPLSRHQRASPLAGRIFDRRLTSAGRLNLALEP
jgi:hypothetical protein